MSGKIYLEIVTPEGVVLTETVDEFTAPSVQGEFGVLPEHRPLLAGLKTGIFSYVLAGERHQVAVGPGFVRVGENEASVLTDSYQAREGLDPVVLRKELKETEAALAALSPDADEDAKSHHIKAARWAAVRLELYGDPPPATIILDHEIRLLGHEDYAETLMKTERAEDHMSGEHHHQEHKGEARA